MGGIYFHRVKENSLWNTVNTWPLHNKYKPSSWKDLTWRGSRKQSQDNEWFLPGSTRSCLRNPLGDWYQCFCDRRVLVKTKSKDYGKTKSSAIFKKSIEYQFLKKAGNPKLYLLRTSVQIASLYVNGTYLPDTLPNWRLRKLC